MSCSVCQASSSILSASFTQINKPEAFRACSRAVMSFISSSVGIVSWSIVEMYST